MMLIGDGKIPGETNVRTSSLMKKGLRHRKPGGLIEGFLVRTSSLMKKGLRHIGVLIRGSLFSCPCQKKSLDEERIATPWCVS